MNITDLKFLEQNLTFSDLMGSDSSLGNILLLEPKYKTEIKINGNYLFRKYFGKESRFGYAFPIQIEQKNSLLKDAINFIFSENTNKTDVNFCLCTQKQKNELDECFRIFFNDLKIDWKTNRDDCDYVYLQEKLEKLPGSSLQKKKNHISRFMRFYENKWQFKYFSLNSFVDEQEIEKIKSDILNVEEKWFLERSNDVEKQFEYDVLLLEKDSIKKALDNAKDLNLSGGIIYINQNPVAMTLASPIGKETIDIHFEKVLSEVAGNGGYAAINNFFVKECKNFKYINREEDMGVEGLRKAKLSYKPEILLDKFYGRVVKC